MLIVLLVVMVMVHGSISQMQMMRKHIQRARLFLRIMSWSIMTAVLRYPEKL